MCKPASFVLTKDNVFWSKTSDSHEDIISEHNLHPDGARGANVVRIEITPPNDDYTLPIGQWVYKLDQDDTPKWYSKESAIERVMLSLPDWVASKIVLPNQERELIVDGDIVLAVYGTVNRVSGGTVNEVDGNGTVNRVSGGTVNWVYGGTVNWVSGGTVNWVDGGTVNRVDGGTVNWVDGGTVNRVDGGTVNRVSGGTVNWVYGNGTICAYKSLPDIKIDGKGVVIDRSGDTVIVRTCNDK